MKEADKSLRAVGMPARSVKSRSCFRRLPQALILLAAYLARPSAGFSPQRHPSIRHGLTAASAPIEYNDFLPCPNPDVGAVDVVHICMDALMSSDDGLEVCFNFGTGTLQKSFDPEQWASNPSFKSLLECTSYEIASVGNEIPGSNTRGAMQTVLMDVQSPESRDKRFLWTLQRERRPPRQNCWLVHEVLFTDMAFQQTE